jgi:hypothetical protein
MWFDKLTTNGATVRTVSLSATPPTKPTQATQSQPVRPEPVEGLHCTGLDATGMWFDKLTTNGATVNHPIQAHDGFTQATHS